MGCGKTIQGIAIAKHYGGRCIVICPSYLCRGWVRECETWGLSATHVDKIKTDVPEGNVVVSYSIATKLVFKLGKFNVALVDESHYLKNHRTKRYKALRKLLQRTPRNILLSGTPAPNSPVELYTQLSILRPKFFGTYTDFVHRYCGAKQSPLGFVDVSGATNKEGIGVADAARGSDSEVETRRADATAAENADANRRKGGTPCYENNTKEI